MRLGFLFFVLMTGCSSDFRYDDAGSDSATSDAGAMADTSSGMDASGAIKIVQASSTKIISGVDATLTLQPSPQPGNALIVAISCFSEVDNCTIPTDGVTDNQGNTWTRVVEGASIISSTTHGARGYIFIAPTVGPTNGMYTITVNPNGDPMPTQSFAWGAIEVAGLATMNTVDRTGTIPVLSNMMSTTVTTTNMTSQANELAVAVHTMRSNDDNVNYGHEADWTEHHLNVNGISLAPPHSMVTKILSAPGTASHTWTHDAPSRGASAIIATFRGR